MSEDPRLDDGSNEAKIFSSNTITNPIDAHKLLEFGSKQIISLFVPVSICMFLVGVIAKNINFYQSTQQYLFYTPFHTENADAATTVWQSLANSLIFIGFVAVMTVLLVLLYKYQCYKFIYGYLIFATVLILFVMFILFFVAIGISLDVHIDYLTLGMFVWNSGAVGFAAIHWKGPLIVQQAYLILISAKLSLVLLKFLPLWTTWVLLGVLAIWDLIAVLCPYGPLKILVELAQERNEPLFPALIYSTTATLVFGVKLNANSTESSQSHSTEEINNPDIQLNSINQETDAHTDTADQNHNENEVEIVDPSRTRRNIQDIHNDVINRGDRGVKLGLGDFVFYSLLMGRATLDSDPATVLACYAAILMGMFLTLVLLAVAGRALPALPISMACGILFYFLTSLLISPFTYQLSINQVFI